MAKDTYGYPFLSEVEVFLRSGTNTVAVDLIDGLLAPGVNFKLRVGIDSGMGEPYAPYAVREGDPLDLLVRVNGIERSLIQGALAMRIFSLSFWLVR